MGKVDQTLHAIEGKYVLIIHSKATVKEKMLIMIEALRRFDLGDIYIKPALRELLEEYKKDYVKRCIF